MQLSRRAPFVAAVLVISSLGHTGAQTAGKVPGGGGLNIAVYEAGNPAGPAIVFIHGFVGTHLAWQQQFSSSLARDFHLLALDLRGHGASDKPLDPKQYTASDLWAEDIDAVIRAKKLDRPVLVGWSYGGYIMADYVRKFGDDGLGGLVFVGAVTKAGTEAAQRFMTEEVLKAFDSVLSSDVRTRIDATRAFLRQVTEQPLPPEAFEVLYGGAMMVPAAVRLAMFSRTLENDDVLSRVKVPTLVVHGARDRLVRVSAAEHIAKTVPHATMHLYEGIGHAPPIEDAERFNRDLAAFVRTARKSGSS